MVNKLFVRIVAIVLRLMPEKPEIVGLLCDMFRVERFYDVTRVRVRSHGPACRLPTLAYPLFVIFKDIEQEQFEDAVGEFARVEAEDKMRISVFAAQIVNAFGEGHGFDMLGNVLESTTNVALMKTTFRLIASVCPTFSLRYS